MPHHVVVDGSNLATEGRTIPSLQQLDEAVRAYIAEQPEALITVVVDATFGHRIDPREVAAFDAAVAANEIVAPPAGAIGRGDAFVLSIAHKVNATILTNDSYQEFHGQYAWLFDEGRIVGGKPVPHIGWVFVNRTPVRGPLSRKSMQVSKRSGGRRGSGSGGAGAMAEVRQGSPEASKPMPVPSAPPPGALPPTSRGGAKPGQRRPEKVGSTGAAAAAPSPVAAAEGHPTRGNGTNDLLPFLTFVELHPPGSSVSAIVDHYSSHGAYVTIGDVKGYVPLRLMADPAPRSAREFMKVGESVTLVVESFAAARRSIDLAVPALATAKPVEPAPRKARTKKQAAEPVAAEPVVPEPVAAAPRRVSKKAAAAATAAAEAAGEALAFAAAEHGQPTAASLAAASAPAQTPAKRTPAKRTPAKRTRKVAGSTAPPSATDAASEAVAGPAPELPRSPEPAGAPAAAIPPGATRSRRPSKRPPEVPEVPEPLPVQAMAPDPAPTALAATDEAPRKPSRTRKKAAASPASTASPTVGRKRPAVGPSALIVDPVPPTFDPVPPAISDGSPANGDVTPVKAARRRRSPAV